MVLHWSTAWPPLIPAFSPHFHLKILTKVRGGNQAEEMKQLVAPLAQLG